MLSRDQKSELLALALLAVALFLLLALVPVGFLGSEAEEWFPSGSVVGVVGFRVRVWLLGSAGFAAVLAPLLLGAVGLQLGGWLERGRGARAAAFGAGLLLVLPPALHIATGDAAATGRLGRLFGEPLVEAVGWLGGLLLLFVVFTLLSVATLGWNPLRLAGRVALAMGARVADGGSWVLERLLAVWIGWRERRKARPGRRRARIGPDREPALASAEEGAAAGADGASGPEEPVGAARRGKDGTGDPDGAFQGAFPPQSLLHDPAGPADLLDVELPSLELLSASEHENGTGMDRELDRLGEVLVEKLRTFNVESDVVGRTTGPVVTQYEVVPAPGVKVNRIANLEADLALAMKARTIRIVAPIPGKGAVGVEIPNPSPRVVRVREILEGGVYGSSRAELPLALGKDLRGDPYVADLARMPHCLIAGATGSGKSVCLNTVITSLVYRHTAETLRLLLIDPKMVELSTYADLPHLRHPVVTDPREAAGVLKWAVLEMERRYALLSANGARSLREFNRRVREERPLRRAEPAGPEDDPDRWIYTDGLLPYIVLVVDELADLMMTVQAEVEKPLTHLAQKARAIGIHLIVATQRPSVNVITGLIKANFPCRIAFRVASKTDSRTILDQNGADALLGNGDMLFLPPGQSAPVRIQGAFMSTEETERLVSWFRKRREHLIERGEEEEARARRDAEEDDILQMVREQEAEEAARGAAEATIEERDELFREAAEVCIRNDQGSTSLLQRRLRIGYGRAARIVDQLHEAGVLGPPDGSKPREVLVGLDELEGMLSGGAGRSG